MNPKIIYQIFKILSSSNPTPKTELNYNSNFELLIAVMLSARTTDKTVNQITAKLFKLANTPEKMLKLKVNGVKRQIKSSGFFNTKAANIIKTCEILVNKFHSQVPKSRDDLENLPGVGRKTTNVILNVAFGKPTIAVDTHVFRVANRIGLVQGKTPEQVEQQLLKIIPKHFSKIVGNLLILHGRYICISRKPKCQVCLINKLCEYPHKTDV